MKVINTKKGLAIVVLLLISVLIVIFGFLLRDKLFITEKNNINEDITSKTIKTEDNSVNYSSPTNQQTNAVAENNKDDSKSKPSEKYANKMIISNSGKIDSGDYEMSVYSSELKDQNARCILNLNGSIYSEVGVHIYPHMAVCKGFTILKKDIKDGKNSYTIEMISNNYKDRITGEF